MPDETPKSAPDAAETRALRAALSKSKGFIVGMVHAFDADPDAFTMTISAKVVGGGSGERRDLAKISAADVISEASAALGETTDIDACLVSRAALDVLAERRRQVEYEGFDDAVDDHLDPGVLAMMAANYAASGAAVSYPLPLPGTGGYFESVDFKPTTRRRDMVKAAALCLAEVEKIDRAAARDLEVAADLDAIVPATWPL